MAKPTESELGILRVLWERGELSVREVHAALESERGVGYTTILKQLQMMHDRGLVTRREEGRAHVYRASFDREAWLGGLVDSFFGGSLRQLVLGALAGSQPDKEEIEEVRRLLEEHEKDGETEMKGKKGGKK